VPVITRRSRKRKRVKGQGRLALWATVLFLSLLAFVVGSLLGRYFMAVLLAGARDRDLPSLVTPAPEGTGGDAGPATEPPSTAQPPATEPPAAQPAPATSQPPAAPPATESVTVSLPAATWYAVQLGVFSQLSNAESLRARLDTSGTAAVVLPGPPFKIRAAYSGDEDWTRGISAALSRQGYENFVARLLLNPGPVRLTGPAPAVRALEAAWEAAWLALQGQDGFWLDYHRGRLTADAGRTRLAQAAEALGALETQTRSALEALQDVASPPPALLDAARRLEQLAGHLRAGQASLEAAVAAGLPRPAAAERQGYQAFMTGVELYIALPEVLR